MAKKQKESKPCSLRMDAELFKRLDAFCQETGISKTAVFEKGATVFMDNYNERMNNNLPKAQ